MIKFVSEMKMSKKAVILCDIICKNLSEEQKEMKYRNANDIIPEELLIKLQEYIQGEYIYIPVKERHILVAATDYKTELEKRDAHIYTKYLEGISNAKLAQMYNLSESSIRRIIVKQRKGYTRMKEDLTRVLGKWGMERSEEKQIYNTTWQIGEQYVLKEYRNLKMLERNLHILQILEKMDIPVAKIVPTGNKELYAVYEDRYFFLSKKLPGSNLVRIENDVEIALMMGEIIANLHIAFKQCENADTFWDNSLLDEMNGWIKRDLEKTGWKYISGEEYEEVVSKLADVYDKLPVQLIHRDVHFGNFLFEKGKFSGYIDFDLSQRNIRIFDICYFLLGLLSEEVKLEITREQWFVIVKNVFAGYESKVDLTEDEKYAVPYVMECIELLFVAYFESINDVHCAEDACKIYEFVKMQENKIWRSIR